MEKPSRKSRNSDTSFRWVLTCIEFPVNKRDPAQHPNSMNYKGQNGKKQEYFPPKHRFDKKKYRKRQEGKYNAYIADHDNSLIKNLPECGTMICFFILCAKVIFLSMIGFSVCFQFGSRKC